MDRAIIKFSSVTHAMSAKDIAQKMGYSVSMRKNPNPQKDEGCGYSLAINHNPDTLLNKLDSNYIKYLGYELM